MYISHTYTPIVILYYFAFEKKERKKERKKKQTKTKQNNKIPHSEQEMMYMYYSSFVSIL